MRRSGWDPAGEPGPKRRENRVQRRWWLIASGVGLCIVAFLLWPRSYCKSARDAYGIVVPVCPDGKVHQTLGISAHNLRRGGKGRVTLRAQAVFTVAQADRAQRAVIPEIRGKLSLVDAHGKEVALEPAVDPLKPRKGWRSGRGFTLSDDIMLPAKLDDGDYKLRARIETKVGKGTVDLPLALYAPARIHVLTDRPLYEPGNRILFRALAVRSRDLAPLDNRPGTWFVTDPSGNVVLEEKTPAGEWGVVAGNFLLDAEAPTGSWKISWRSGSDSGDTTVRVEPFTLPRFRVSAAAEEPFYGVGKTPRVKGSVVYSSGAPVQNAKIELTWSVLGRWPAPISWSEGGLPRQAKTDATGSFTLQLPEVPQDLQGKVTLAGRVVAIDPAGDRVEGSVSVLLAKDAIAVSAFTPLSHGGLVAGFNNRLYLRVTTIDGRPLPGAKVQIRKAWLGTGEGIPAELDSDSVGRIQLDPGAPVNIVIPPLPYRKPTVKHRIVDRSRAHDLISDSGAPLNDLVEMDRWLALVEPCAKWRSDDESSAKLAITVTGAGAITAGAASTRLGRCVLERVRRRRLPAGKSRLYSLTFDFNEPKLPRVDQELAMALGDEVPEALTNLVALAARDARDCLPKRGNGALPWVLSWRLAKKATKPTFAWIQRKGEDGEKMPPGIDRCILGRLARHAFPEPYKGAEAVGVVRYTLVEVGGEAVARRPRATIMRGYELLVSASQPDEKGGLRSLGQTKLRLRPGRIPRLRMRVEPVLARPGEKVTVKLIRGPRYRGKLPRVIYVEHFGDTKPIKLPKGVKAGTYGYTIPKGAKGWFTFAAQGKKALVFVRNEEQLAVEVSPERKRYAPGAKAVLRLQTRIGKKGATAAVGLFGVDDSLSQLVPLPGADALGVLRSKVQMTAKAFGYLDGQALTLGRIRGGYAAEATVLRVSSIPSPEKLDIVLNGSAETKFDPNVALVDRFYVVLAALHEQVRSWEKSAPKAEVLRPPLLAKLWKQALAATEAKGKSVKDAFGRRLRLHRLPADLLALTDPRQVVTVGTRLPEDIENWPRWVQRIRP